MKQETQLTLTNRATRKHAENCSNSTWKQVADNDLFEVIQQPSAPSGEWYWRILLENSLFSPPSTCLTPPGEWTPCNINVTYTSLKSAFNWLQFRPSLTIWLYLHSFNCYCIRNTRKSRNSKRIWPYSSSRSSKVIDLGVNGKPICDFLSVINCNFSRTIFEIFTLKDRKVLILPQPSLAWSSCSGWPLSNFVMKFGIKKLESWGYQKVKKSWRYSFLCFDTIPARDGQTDGQTDRHVAVAKTRASIASRG